ncbi:MAG: CARDB domain-containing protein, partial [Candidatus Thermoplasmatota archaeon]|nr:CARDB domain-containing protein [Candidatus Thermoplasmatota archaeon]
IPAGIPPGGSYQVSTVIPAISWAPGFHTILVQVDPFKAIPEKREDNNQASKSLYLLPNVDLLPEIASMTATPALATAGTIITLNVAIRNDGTQDVTSSFKVAFYRDEDDSKLGESTVLGVPAGEARNATLLVAPTEIGDYTVRVEVDSDGTVLEYDETNNMDVDPGVTFTITEVPPNPDLTVSALTFSSPYPAIGTAIDLTASISNIGGSPVAQSFWVMFWDDLNNNGAYDAGEEIGYVEVAGIGALSSTDAVLPWNVVGPRGWHTIYATVDYNNTVVEASETNNRLSAQMLVLNKNLDIIVNATMPTATPGALTLTGTLEHHGYILVEDGGELTLDNAAMTISQDGPFRYDLVVRQNGKLIITDSTLSTTSAMGIMLMDHAEVHVQNSAIGSSITYGTAGISDPAFASNDVLLNMLNTTVSSGLSSFGGSSVGNFTSVLQGASLPAISVQQNAYVNVWWWLETTVRDANNEIIEGARVDIERNTPLMPFDTHKFTGQNGKALFLLNTRNVSASEIVYTQSHNVFASFAFKNSPTTAATITNNRQLTLQVDARPDLEITMVADDMNPDAGDLVTFTLWANNTNGEVGVQSTTVTVRIGTSTVYSANIALAPGGEPGDSFMHSFQWTATAGLHTINASIDLPARKYLELDESNNWDTWQINVAPGVPDPEVLSVTVLDNLLAPTNDVFNNTQVRFMVAIRNSGVATLVEDFTLRIRLNNDTISTSIVTTNINVGQTIYHNITWMAQPSGFYWVEANITLTGDSDPNNNWAFTTLTINPRPNLVVSNIFLSSGNGFRNVPTTIIARVSNIGDQGAGAFGVEFRMGGAGGTLLGTGSVVALGAHSFIDVECATPWTPATAGTHTIYAKADHMNQIVETNENDNTLTKA